jgi:alkaline phosphatase D
VDFVAHPYFDPASDVIFTRVGAVYPDGAKIVVRYPELNAVENNVKAVWRQFKEDAAPDAGWRDGPAFKLTAENDWVSTRRLSGLWPGTTYECESYPVHICFD